MGEVVAAFGECSSFTAGSIDGYIGVAGVTVRDVDGKGSTLLWYGGYIGVAGVIVRGVEKVSTLLW